MNAYRVIAAAGITIRAGSLVLHESQSRPRMHRLTAIGGYRYEVRAPPVWFKRGETFGFEGELPKGMGRSVEAIPIAVLGKWVGPHPRVRGEKKAQQQNPERRARTFNASKKRWDKRDEAREKVLRDWEKLPSRFPSAAQAGRHYGEMLAKQGYRFEARTLTGWIRERAKLRGIKFR